MRIDRRCGALMLIVLVSCVSRTRSAYFKVDPKLRHSALRKWVIISHRCCTPLCSRSQTLTSGGRGGVRQGQYVGCMFISHLPVETLCQPVPFSRRPRRLQGLHSVWKGIWKLCDGKKQNFSTCVLDSNSKGSPAPLYKVPRFCPWKSIVTKRPVALIRTCEPRMQLLWEISSQVSQCYRAREHQCVQEERIDSWQHLQCALHCSSKLSPLNLQIASFSGKTYLLRSCRGWVSGMCPYLGNVILLK